MLWVEKHKPRTLSEFVDQKKAVEQAKSWLSRFKPGKALMLTGPSGTGKTLLAELLARESNLELLQVNASIPGLPEELKRILDSVHSKSIWHSGKLILIDEVDSLSARDRGAVPLILKIIRESPHPVILTAINPWTQRLRPVLAESEQVKFSRIPWPQIARKLAEICRKEGIIAEPSCLQELAKWSQGDLRSAILDLQLIAEGKTRLEERDLAALGYRERESSIFDVLQRIFKAGNIRTAKLAIQSCDKDPDEVFLWIEQNLPLVYEGEELAKAYDLLSLADLYRARVRKQQNWRFRLYMIELLASLSLLKPKEGWISYKPPERLLRLGATKQERAEEKEKLSELASQLHCSVRKVRTEYLPFLKKIGPARTRTGI